MKEGQIEDGWGGVSLGRDQIGERRTIPMGISRRLSAAPAVGSAGV